MDSLLPVFSIIVGILLTHWIEGRRLPGRRREWPAQRLYEKHLEFAMLAAPALDQINGYISLVEVRLADKSNAGRQRLLEAAEEDAPLTRWYDLVDQFGLVLPSAVIEASNTLLKTCVLLSATPTEDQAHRCSEEWATVQNVIRHLLGVDALSGELVRAFRTARRRRHEKEQ